MSFLTVGFKICVYLDRYSNVLARHRTCFACESRRLWFFCQPVHRACVRMTSRVGTHKSSYCPQTGHHLIDDLFHDPLFCVFLRVPLFKVSRCFSTVSLEVWVVYRQVIITIFRMPIYPMLNQCQWPRILASDWTRAIKLGMNIDENIFRMPIYPMLNNMNIDELNISFYVKPRLLTWM